jgi:hypothetical protein
MIAGLTNLDTLKKHLLATTLQAETRFDQVITDIGLGVAAQFENFCNRQFARVVDDVATFQADRSSFILPRYPVEAITLVEVKQKDSGAWITQDLELIQSSSLASGVIYLPEEIDAGRFWHEIRFTFTGGFWWEPLEPDDDGYPSAAPAGAKPLPNDLRLAFLLHCREIWNKLDKLGAGLVDKPDTQTMLSSLDFPTAVRRTLLNYQVMQPI